MNGINYKKAKHYWWVFYYSNLTKKITQFVFIQIFIQLIPILFYTIDSSSDKVLLSNYISILFLSGTSRISVPSFIDKFNWKTTESNLYKYLAYIVGIIIIIFSAIINNYDMKISSNSYLIYPLISSLSAIIFIIYCHLRLLKTISIRLLWIHSAQFTYLYYAEYSGIFERSGLRVKFVEAELDQHPIENFCSVDETFSIVSGIDVIRISALTEQNIRSILPIIRVNPLSIYAKENKGINTFSDLVGKKIGLQENYEIHIYFEAYVKVLGYNLKDFEIVNTGFSVEEFIKNDDISAQVGYIGYEAELCRRKGEKIKEFNLSERFPNHYADTIIVEEAFLFEEKDIVKAFIDSVIKSYDSLQKNKEIALLFTMNHSVEGDKKFQSKLLTRMNHMINSNGRLGDEQKISDWKNMITFLEELEKIEKGTIDINEIFYNF